MLKQYLKDASAVAIGPLQRPYIFPGWPNGVVMQHGTYFSDMDGPGATCACFPDGTGSDAHFHLSSQFQLVCEGEMTFPDHTLAAPAVHYTDHCVPYGPFTVRGHTMLVLRPRRKGATQIFMAALKERKELRPLVNRGGRYFVQEASKVSWTPANGKPGLRRKRLFGAPGGPSAEIIECAPGAECAGDPAPYGQYQVVLSGAATCKDTTLGKRGIRYIEGDEAPPPLRAGPNGAAIALLTFDRDALWRPPEGLKVGPE